MKLILCPVVTAWAMLTTPSGRAWLLQRWGRRATVPDHRSADGWPLASATVWRLLPSMVFSAMLLASLRLSFAALWAPLFPLLNSVG